jgi:hypothetical protein
LQGFSFCGQTADRNGTNALGIGRIFSESGENLKGKFFAHLGRQKHGGVIWWKKISFPGAAR